MRWYTTLLVSPCLTIFLMQVIRGWINRSARDATAKNRITANTPEEFNKTSLTTTAFESLPKPLLLLPQYLNNLTTTKCVLLLHLTNLTSHSVHTFFPTKANEKNMVANIRMLGKKKQLKIRSTDKVKHRKLSGKLELFVIS